MASCTELKEIALSRLKAGEVLMDQKDWDGAFYIMGYALECALKAVICKTLKLPSYPDDSSLKHLGDAFRTHRFDILLTLSGMEYEVGFHSPVQRRFENWSDATSTWTSELRYDPIGTHTEQEVKRFHEALTEQDHGILSWIEKEKRW